MIDKKSQRKKPLPIQFEDIGKEQNLVINLKLKTFTKL